MAKLENLVETCMLNLLSVTNDHGKENWEKLSSQYDYVWSSTFGGRNGYTLCELVVEFVSQ